MDTGLIHIYCGDGKGKTTAAVGLSIRCAGGGGRVLFYQFLKDGSSSEISLLEKTEGIHYLKNNSARKFIFQMTEKEKEDAKRFYSGELVKISDHVQKGEYQLLVLDEVLHAVNAGFVPLEDFLDFLKNKPGKLEVVMTGRNHGE